MIIKLLCIYFLLSGLICHYLVTKKLTMTEEEIKNLPEKKREKEEELRRDIYVNFGDLNILPIIQVLSLILGWLLLPIALIFKILDILNIKTDL